MIPEVEVDSDWLWKLWAEERMNRRTFKGKKEIFRTNMLSSTFICGGSRSDNFTAPTSTAVLIQADLGSKLGVVSELICIGQTFYSDFHTLVMRRKIITIQRLSESHWPGTPHLPELSKSSTRQRRKRIISQDPRNQTSEKSGSGVIRSFWFLCISQQCNWCVFPEEEIRRILVPSRSFVFKRQTAWWNLSVSHAFLRVGFPPSKIPSLLSLLLVALSLYEDSVVPSYGSMTMLYSDSIRNQSIPYGIWCPFWMTEFAACSVYLRVLDNPCSALPRESQEKTKRRHERLRAVALPDRMQSGFESRLFLFFHIKQVISSFPKGGKSYQVRE